MSAETWTGIGLAEGMEVGTVNCLRKRTMRAVLCVEVNVGVDSGSQSQGVVLVQGGILLSNIAVSDSVE